MSTLRPIGFQSAPLAANATKITKTQFAGGTQSSTQRGDNGPQATDPPRTTRPQSTYTESFIKGVIYGLGYGIEKLVVGASYVVPNFIQAPIKQKVLAVLDTAMHDPDAPQTKVLANHELGHALAAWSANAPMVGLRLANYAGAAGQVGLSHSAPTGTESCSAFYQKLIFIMAGHGAELNRATSDELKDQKFIGSSRKSALSDIAQAIPLIRHAHEKGWIQLKPDQIPPNIDFKKISKLAQKANRTQEETEQLQKIGPQIRDFFKLPIVQHALQAAREIHAVIPPEKRERMVDDITHNPYGALVQDELYQLLKNHISTEEFQRMQAIQERFIQRQSDKKELNDLLGNELDDANMERGQVLLKRLIQQPSS